jgi:hypothetical protein
MICSRKASLLARASGETFGLALLLLPCTSARGAACELSSVCAPGVRGASLPASPPAALAPVDVFGGWARGNRNASTLASAATESTNAIRLRGMNATSIPRISPAAAAGKAWAVRHSGDIASGPGYRCRMKRALLAWLGAGVLLAGIAWLVSTSALVIDIDRDVPVSVRGKVPLEAEVSQRVEVEIAEELNASVKLGRMEIPLDETIEVPLDFRLAVPVDTAMQVNETLEVATTVPIDIVLTERELDLGKLEIPIDTEVYIDDTIDVELEIPFDTEVETTLGLKVPAKGKVPVKAKVPIRQKVRVRDTVRVAVPKLRVPLRMQLPVRAQVPIRQSIHVKGEVDVPVRRKLKVPIKQVVRPDLDDAIAAQVKLTGKLPAELQAKLHTEVTIDQAIPTRIGQLRFDIGDVAVERR